MSDYDKYMVEASGHCFTAHLPDDWDTWEREELDDWCELCAWEPFEYHETSWVFEQVQSIALSIHRCAEEATKPLLEEIERLNDMVDELTKGEG